MRLLIIRHAIAVPRGTPGIPDEDRPLTPRGVRRFEVVARGLARIVPRPDALLTSPLKRARQTAEIAAEAWGGITPREDPALAGGRPEEIAALLGRFGKEGTVAIVGHEPHLSSLLARLLGSTADERLVFRKGGAALLDLASAVDRGGTLIWYMPPRILRRLAR